MSAEWYESFFSPLLFDFWQAAVPTSAASDEVDFLVRELAISPPARVLDLPCGLGRHSIVLASRGFQVTAIDLSPHAIVAAQRLARAQGVNATFHVGDMRHPPPGSPFDAACCLGNSFCYLSREDMTPFIRNVLVAMHPGGRWLIDTGAVAEALFPSLAEERTLEAGGVTYTVQNRYDASAKRLRQSATLVRGTEREEAEISYAVHTIAELKQLFGSVGWRVVATYGGLDGRPFQPGDRRVLLIVERPVDP